MQKNKAVVGGMMVLWAVIIYLIRDHTFFWDTIQLGSKHAHWYFEQNFSVLLLPAEIDSGHPPIFGMYLALLWKLFGKTLWVSHLAMLPFIWGSIYLLWQLGRYWLPEKEAIWPLLLSFSLPVWVTQCTLISPDVVLVCFFLLLLVSIFRRRPYLIGLAACVLALISTRGMMLVFALAVFDLLRTYVWDRAGRHWFRIVAQQIPVYIPSGLLALAFLGYHYVETGWIGYHADSPWAPSFARVSSLSGGLRNIAVLGFKMLELGMVWVWLVLGLTFWWLRHYKLYLWSKVLQELYLLLALLSLLLLPPMLLHQNLLAHRYLLPLYLPLLWIVALWLMKLKALTKGKSRILLALLLIGLWSGHLWLYPDRIAYGWDASLAHVPHYDLRQKMLQEVRDRAIPLREIGTAFPEIGPLRYKDLSDIDEGYAPKDLSRQNYILYAKTMNDFTDEELAALQGPDWTPIVELERRGIRFTLYERGERGELRPLR